MTMQIEELKATIKNNEGAASILTDFIQKGDIIHEEDGSFTVFKEASPIKAGDMNQME